MLQIDVIMWSHIDMHIDNHMHTKRVRDCAYEFEGTHVQYTILMLVSDISQ